MRFIPAPAGNTAGAALALTVEAVHPRACGEHATPCCSPSPQRGSSPRLRGTRAPRPHSERSRRFIPAPAGNTSAETSTEPRYPVHPRACGEHKQCRHDGGQANGSSPRLRGTRGALLFAASWTRFIPAPAGNTRGASGLRCPWAVHPRACGEHHWPTWARPPLFGSSPRLRGTPGPRAAEVRKQRFIPAPAGTTHLRTPGQIASPVHPRACGEHLSCPSSALPACGSSPRLRGTPNLFTSEAAAQRFIPAPAGNTTPPARYTDALPVHPRACGEHWCLTAGSIQAVGSSPRLRGTPAL